MLVSDRQRDVMIVNSDRDSFLHRPGREIDREDNAAKR
jgi:hypothetical protein